MKTTVAKQGQSLAEYTLIGGVIALVSIGGLMALSNSLGQQVNTMHGFFEGSSQQANAAQNNAAPAATAQAALPVANAGASPYPMTMAGYEQMLADMPMIIETTGASGATKQMLAFMQAYTEQALAEGKITPAVAGQLTDLANLGHNLATYQQMLIDRIDDADPNMHRSELAAQRITLLNNEETNLYHFAPEIQIFENSYLQSLTWEERTDFLARPFSEKSEAIINYKKAKPNEEIDGAGEQFLDLYVSLNNSGALQDPAVANIIEQLAGGVAELSESVWLVGRNFSTWGHDKTVGELKADAYYGWGDRNQQAVKAVQSHVKSEGICTAGDGQDTGTFCSG